jgi:hypothetical protein
MCDTVATPVLDLHWTPYNRRSNSIFTYRHARGLVPGPRGSLVRYQSFSSIIRVTLTYRLGLGSISPLPRARFLRENLSAYGRHFAVRPRASDYCSFACLLARYSPTCVLLYKRGTSCHKGLLSRSFQSIKLTVTHFKHFFILTILFNLIIH